MKAIKSFLKKTFPSGYACYQRVVNRKSDTWLRILEKISKESQDIFFIEIGAMDGVSFDLLHGFANKFNWGGLVVEPLPDYFENLKENYRHCPNILFENSAISSSTGTKTLYRIDPNAIREHNLPDWLRGVSSLHTDRNVLSGNWTPAKEFEELKKHIIEVQVQTLTVEDLFRKHNIQKFDILQIDTEGHDFEILRQINFDKYRPRAIMIEWINLTAGEKKAVRAIFKSNNYRTILVGQDVVAYDL